MAGGPDAMWSCVFDGRARLGISLALLVIAPEMSTFPTLTSQGELFDAAVASVYVTLCSSVGTSLLLCIRAPADNIKSLALGGRHRSHVMVSLLLASVSSPRACRDGGNLFAPKPREYSHRDWMITPIAEVGGGA